MNIDNPPTCMVCYKPVDKIDFTYDPNFDYRVYRTYCHEQVEKHILTPEIFEKSLHIRFDFAFQQKALT